MGASQNRAKIANHGPFSALILNMGTNSYTRNCQILPLVSSYYVWENKQAGSSPSREFAEIPAGIGAKNAAIILCVQGRQLPYILPQPSLSADTISSNQVPLVHVASSGHQTACICHLPFCWIPTRLIDIEYGKPDLSYGKSKAQTGVL